jgi:outer membrane receptor for ferrienterochelin and colicins
MGGLINIITKTPFTAPQLSAEFLMTSWLETNTDLGLKYHLGKIGDALIGVNYFRNSEVIDNDKDGFTDLSLQDRISIFHKVSFNRKNNRVFNIGLRGMYEDRWGGDIRWGKKYRGGDVIYGKVFTPNAAKYSGITKCRPTKN